MEKLTDKLMFVFNLLKGYKDGTNAYVMLNDHKQDLEKVGIKTDRINSLNASLACLVSKGVATKTKKAYNDKIVTFYQVVKDN